MLIPDVKICPSKNGEAKVTSATANPAPGVTPIKNGPANGLRKRVCIIKPLMASAIPVTAAPITRGTRNSQNKKGFCKSLGSKFKSQYKHKEMNINNIKLYKWIFFFRVFRIVDSNFKDTLNDQDSPELWNMPLNGELHKRESSN